MIFWGMALLEGDLQQTYCLSRTYFLSKETKYSTGPKLPFFLYEESPIILARSILLVWGYLTAMRRHECDLREIYCNVYPLKIFKITYDGSVMMYDLC